MSTFTLYLAGSLFAFIAMLTLEGCPTDEKTSTGDKVGIGIGAAIFSWLGFILLLDKYDRKRSHFKLLEEKLSDKDQVIARKEHEVEVLHNKIEALEFLTTGEAKRVETITSLASRLDAANSSVADLKLEVKKLQKCNTSITKAHSAAVALGKRINCKELT